MEIPKVRIQITSQQATENAITLRAAQVGSVTSMHSPPNSQPFSDAFVKSTADVIGSFVSEFLDDLSISMEILASLLELVRDRPVRDAPSGRMVTTPADHAGIIQNILSALDQQVNMFSLPCSQSVPKTPIPVNILSLELELMVEVLPSGSDRKDITLLERVEQYLETYKDLILNWMALSGRVSSTVDQQGHCLKAQKLHECSLELNACLDKLMSHEW